MKWYVSFVSWGMASNCILCSLSPNFSVLPIVEYPYFSNVVYNHAQGKLVMCWFIVINYISNKGCFDCVGSWQNIANNLLVGVSE